MKQLLRQLAARVDTSGADKRMREFRSGWPAQSAVGIHFHKTEQVQYRYRMAGAGRTIVFAVDPPVTLELYDELFSFFERDYRVIAVELPAMGFSATEADYGFDFRKTNDDLADFLRTVAGEQAVLAFSCVAGLAAVDIAVRHPELVSRLVLMQVASVAGFARWKAKRDPKGLLAKPVIGQILMKKIAPKRMPAWFKLALGRQDRMKQFCDCAEASFDHGALWSLASGFQIYMDPQQVLGKAKQPTLAIWGLADGSHGVESVESTNSLAEHVQGLTYEHLGHFPELEEPEVIFQAIHGFLSECDAA